MMLVRLAMQAYFLSTGEEEAVGEYARMLADAAKQGFTLEGNSEDYKKPFCGHCELPMQKIVLLSSLAPQDWVCQVRDWSSAYVYVLNYLLCAT